MNGIITTNESTKEEEEKRERKNIRWKKREKKVNDSRD